MTTEELWQAAIGEIELSVSKANFVTWIKNARIVERDSGVARLEVPNQFTKEWLRNKCDRLILRALRNIDSEIKKVEYVVAERPILVQPRKKATISGAAVAKMREQQPALLEEIDYETNLNPRFVFDNFIVGPFNELAHAAALSITQLSNLGKEYNPLFIYGGVGLGKTHLLQAIGNKIIQSYRSKIRVRYVNSEIFTSELVRAIQEKRIDDFKEEYRKIDLLIIDDIQFIGGKEKTQIEFFHTFNSLYGANKQIVLSSDRPPKAIPALEERLRSRFEGGMMVDISIPDFESRMAILQMKASHHDLFLDDKLVRYIASRIQSNIRELEGALKKMVIYTQTQGEQPDLTKTKDLLASLINRPRKRTTPSAIMQTVAEFYETPLKDIVDRGRKKELVKPRQICMYLLREELQESYPVIGKKMGGRDHTTVIHAVDKISRELKENEMLEMEMNLIRERLYNM